MESSVVKGLFVRSTLGAASLIALTLLIFSARGDTPPASASKQVIVIGIDGATWEIIDALRSQGKLPTFDRLIRAGSRGELAVPLPSIQQPGKLSRFGMPVVKSTTLLEHLHLKGELHATNIGDLVFLRPRDRSRDLGGAKESLESVVWAEGGGSDGPYAAGVAGRTRHARTSHARRFSSTVGGSIEGRLHRLSRPRFAIGR
ncbi:MAG: hypothetical protein ABGW98_09545 [Myxococcales bacterium]